jgi:hypothetical protein
MGACSFRAGNSKLQEMSAPMVFLGTHRGNILHNFLEDYVKGYTLANPSQLASVPILTGGPLAAIHADEKSSCLAKCQAPNNARYDHLDVSAQLETSIRVVFNQVDFRQLEGVAYKWLFEYPYLTDFFLEVPATDIHAEQEFNKIFKAGAISQHWKGFVDLYWVHRKDKVVYIIDYKSTTDGMVFDSDDEKEAAFAALTPKYKSQLETYACFILKELERELGPLDDDWKFKGSMLRENSGNRFLNLVAVTPSQIRKLEHDLVTKANQLLQTPMAQTQGPQCSSCHIRTACAAYSDNHFQLVRSPGGGAVWDLDARVTVGEDGTQDGYTVFSLHPHTSNYSELMGDYPVEIHLDLEGCEVSRHFYDVLVSARAEQREVQLLELVGEFIAEEETQRINAVVLKPRMDFSLRSKKAYCPKHSEAFILD